MQLSLGPSLTLTRMPRGHPEEQRAHGQNEEEQPEQEYRDVISAWRNPGPVAAAAQLEEFPEAVHARQSSPAANLCNRKKPGETF